MFKGKFFYSSKESSIMKNVGFNVTILWCIYIFFFVQVFILTYGE
jgi:hypothetical protein